MRVEDPSPEVLQKIKRALTVRPFSFNKLRPPVSFNCYAELPDGSVDVPRYWGESELGLVAPPPPPSSGEWAFLGTLRPEQEEIIGQVLPAVRQNGGGVLQVPCGKGKTCMAIYLMTRLAVKTLVVVHKQQLVSQWRESLAKFTDLSVGRIQQGCVDADHPVVIGMLQSLSMREYPREVLDSFGFLVVDEVHNVATCTFSRLLARVAPAFTLGLSATPQRPDGTSRVFHWYLGPMLYRLTAREAASREEARGVVVRVHSFSPPFCQVNDRQGQPNLPMMLTILAANAERNALLVREVLALSGAGRSVLVLGSRIEQLRALQEKVPGSGLYIGSRKQCELREVLDTAQVVLATYEMANEGFDLPRLTALVFATPRSRVEQAVGRILRRIDPRYPPIVVDVIDQLPCFIQQGSRRKAFYKSLGYSVMLGGQAP